MNEIYPHLEEVFGLSRYESKIYVALLELGGANISSLASASKVPRTAVYVPLRALLQKGFVTVQKIHKKHTMYFAVSPEALSGIFERKKLDFQELVALLGKLSSGGGEINIRYFEGLGGIQTAGDLFLKNAKVKLWKTFENATRMEKLSGEYFFEQYVKQRAKRGISARVILPSAETTPWVQKIISKKVEYLLDIRMVSSEIYPIDASIAVSGEWVFISVANKKPFAVLIQSLALGRTVESIHDMVWDRYSV